MQLFVRVPDGPHDVGLSTGSELGGLAGLLLLVASLARLWGLKQVQVAITGWSKVRQLYLK